jgi:UDP-N-acetyl-D-mannosaminuronic acid dehydrogenase
LKINSLNNTNYLQNLIETKSANIGVIGLGQVGLPTALSFCDVGFSVIGNDLNQPLLQKLSRGESPFEELGLNDLLKSSIESKKFIIETDFKKTIDDSDIIIVCVPTPLGDGIKPNLSALENVCTSLSNLDLKEKLIIIESSIPPGTMENIVLPLLQKMNKECMAAFVPERLSPGQAFSEIRTTPRIIGYIDKISGELVKLLYGNLVTSEIFVTHVKIAEISKLVENTYRDVNIALANEISFICEKYGIDFLELQKVCNSHPRVNLLDAGPGVGGPCLPKDPYLLLNPSNSDTISSQIIESARKTNDSMPNHVVEIVKSGLARVNKSLEDSKITVFGVSYKANVSDVRLSPAKDIILKLIESSKQVIVYDPKSSESFGAEKSIDLWDSISGSDVLIIVTNHDEFKNLDLNQIKSKMKTPIIVDTRRIFDSNRAEEIGIMYYAVGYRGKHS